MSPIKKIVKLSIIISARQAGGKGGGLHSAGEAAEGKGRAGNDWRWREEAGLFNIPAVAIMVSSKVSHPQADSSQ